MASNYARGRAFEYRVRNKLREMGAVYVMRAAQSKGAADLAAFWPQSFVDVNSPVGGRYIVPAPAWLVQCKTGKARMSPADKAVLVEIADEVGARAVLAEPGKPGIKFTNLN